MGKLQYIFKQGMTEYPKMRNGMSCCMNVENTGTVKFLSQLLYVIIAITMVIIIIIIQ